MVLWIDGGGGAEGKLSVAGATWRRQRPSEAGPPGVFCLVLWLGLSSDR